MEEKDVKGVNGYNGTQLYHIRVPTHPRNHIYKETPENNWSHQGLGPPGYPLFCLIYLFVMFYLQ